ncbi:hypothetical protein HRbin11_02009 [bacterium HR11]|nr:hypothetical protein HRbin11_02009 [bacterium HR11]
MDMASRRQDRTYVGTALGLGVLALGLHWAVIVFRAFDGLYGQDAFAYYDYAVQLRASLRQGRWPPPFFWPVGYPALVAALFPLVGVTPRAGQVVSSLAGAGVVLLCVGIVRRLLEQQGFRLGEARRVGLLAGLIALASGQLWHWSLTVMADTAALFWGALAAWAAVRYGGSGRLRWVLLSAFALAWAVLTRWVYALLILPLGIYGLWAVRRYGRKALAHGLLGCVVGLSVLAPQAVLLRHSGHVPWRHPWLTGWSPGHAFRRTLETVDGHAEYPLPVALFYAKAFVSPRSLFPLWTPFWVLGLWTVFRHRWGRILALLGGWTAGMYGFLAGIPYENFRFALALLPATAGLTAIGLYQSGGGLGSRGSGPEEGPGVERRGIRAFVLRVQGIGRRVLRPLGPTGRRRLVVGSLVVGGLGSLAYNGRVIDAFLDRKDADLAVARWVERTVEPDARVLAFGITLTLRYYTGLDVAELYTCTPQDLARLGEDGRPAYLVVPLADLARQWRDRPPERNYRWLRDGPGLLPVGSQGGYTLFRVGVSRENAGPRRPGG